MAKRGSRGRRRSGSTEVAPVTVRIEIEDLETGRAVADPFQVVVNEGEKVIWNFDEIDAERYQPEVVWVSFRRKEKDKPTHPRPAFGQLKASGNRVVSDGCRSGFEGLHAYDVWLMPRKGNGGSPKRLVAGSQAEQIQDDPDPPDFGEIKVESR